MESGFDSKRPAIVASTGVSMYLTKNAIAIAERLPAARKGTVEIRPIVELPGLSSEK